LSGHINAPLRHVIENFFARLGEYRAIAICNDKTSRNFRAAV
jgi:transposase